MQNQVSGLARSRIRTDSWAHFCRIALILRIWHDEKVVGDVNLRRSSRIIRIGNRVLLAETLFGRRPGTENLLVSGVAGI